jgi:hypothetical protein
VAVDLALMTLQALLAQQTLVAVAVAVETLPMVAQAAPE